MFVIFCVNGAQFRIDGFVLCFFCVNEHAKSMFFATSEIQYWEMLNIYEKSNKVCFFRRFFFSVHPAIELRSHVPLHTFRRWFRTKYKNRYNVQKMRHFVGERKKSSQIRLSWMACVRLTQRFVTKSLFCKLDQIEIILLSRLMEQNCCWLTNNSSWLKIDRKYSPYHHAMSSTRKKNLTIFCWFSCFFGTSAFWSAFYQLIPEKYWNFDSLHLSCSGMLELQIAIILNLDKNERCKKTHHHRTESRLVTQNPNTSLF